jgi:hypothetical protein
MAGTAWSRRVEELERAFDWEDMEGVWDCVWIVTGKGLFKGRSEGSRRSGCGLGSVLDMVCLCDEAGTSRGTICSYTDDPGVVNKRCSHCVAHRVLCMPTGYGNRVLSAMGVIGWSLKVSELSFSQYSSYRARKGIKAS